MPGSDEVVRPVVLVAALGDPGRPYDEAVYSLSGRPHKTRFAPVAVAALSGQIPSSAILLLTKAARQANLAGVRDELAALGVGRIREVEIRDAEAPGATSDLLDGLLAALRQEAKGSRLLIDLTLGVRTLPFIMYGGIVAAKDLFGLEVAGVFYCSFTTKTPEKPLIDLTPALELHDWHGAIRLLRAGDPRPMAALVRRDDARRRRAPDEVAATTVASRLEALAGPMQECLLVEEAMVAEEASQLFEKCNDQNQLLACDSAIARVIVPALTDWVRQARPPGRARPVQSKSAMGLDRDWLQHQLTRIEQAAAQGRASRALLALSEWLISRVVLARGEGARWLDKEVRQRAHGSLFASRLRSLPPGLLYHEVSNRRNPLAHGGMGTETCKVPTQGALDGLVERARASLSSEHDEQWALRQAASGRLLITALGLSKGLLHSAIVLEKPDHVILVTSKDAALALPEVEQRLGAALVPITKLVIDDPFTDIGAAARAFGEGSDRNDGSSPGRRAELLHLLESHAEIVCNITGGTTVLQVNVEWLCEEARRLDGNVRRIALMDRRPADQQRSEPWVLGEVVELDRRSDSRTDTG